MAKKLGIQDWYANTQLIWAENGLLIDFDYQLDQAQEKVIQLEKYLATHGYKKEECLIVGDSESDLELFKTLPYGIAVSNKVYPALEKLAWKTITQLSEIKTLL